MLQFSKHDIIKVDKKGITFKTPNGDFQVLFSECKRNFAAEFELKDIKCVGTRDITIPNFIFYSNPKVEVLFEKRSFFRDLFSKRTWIQEFYDFQKLLLSLGHATYDMS